MIKKLLRLVIVKILGWQVRRLQRRHQFKVVGVAGSVGKTSAKFAIATVLAQKYRVRFQAGNYNDLVTVPLIFFGKDLPSLFNPFAWLKVLISNELQLRKPYAYDVVVVEVGTDYPGNLIKFGAYLRLDIAVVTAISPEHMEFFANLDDVATEELSVGVYADKLVVNADLCDPQYLNIPGSMVTFGGKTADYKLQDIKFSEESASYQIHHQSQVFKLRQAAVAKSEIYSATAASVVAELLALDKTQILAGVALIKPVSGRMQRLAGRKDSIILDETYNASPDAVMAALDSLYIFKSAHKIVILGNMNELGQSSASAHQQIGAYCDPEQLELVVTIGPDANQYLAPAAEEAGCRVKTFTDPYAAGQFVKDQLQPGSVILAKGSQNLVYAEEAIKPLLADPADSAKLVRQSAAWTKKKQENFKHVRI
ncbi:MAG: UDP-N-acetylmuramoyl-tripeptide--D-alanyl-D-alanine ligase [Candidatus Saccharimonadales bacterium]